MLATARPSCFLLYRCLKTNCYTTTALSELSKSCKAGIPRHGHRHPRKDPRKELARIGRKDEKRVGRVGVGAVECELEVCFEKQTVRAVTS